MTATRTHIPPTVQSPTAEAAELTGALAAARLESANRLAAIRAALSAAADGETDPLAYLRDHLAEEATHRHPGRRENRL